MYHPPTHTSYRPTTKAAHRTGQVILDLARRTKGRRVLPLTSLKVSQVSCRSRQLAASLALSAQALCLHRHCVCRRGEARAKLSLGSRGRGAAFKVQEGQRGPLNSDSAAVLGSALGRSVTSTEVSKQNKLVSAPTDTQATLVAQLPWVRLAWSVIHVG